jgi:hypothetical protein
MRFLFEWLLKKFGKHPLGQLAAATVIGALIGIFMIIFSLEKGKPLPDHPASWMLYGAMAGLVGGLFLLSPSRFFGTIFTLLGIFITVVPILNGLGGAWTKEHAITVAIGLAFLMLGMFLYFYARKRSARQARAARLAGLENSKSSTHI